MVVILTVGLSMASRTTQQAETSIQQETATRVFNAAEYGIEEALSRIYEAEEAGQTVNDSTFNLSLENSLSNIAATIDSDSELEIHLEEGATSEINLSGNAGSLTIYWSRSGTTGCTLLSNTAALLLSVYSDNSGTITAQHYAVDGCNTARGNSFQNPVGSASLANYVFSHRLDLAANSVQLRIRPLYAGTDIVVQGIPISRAQYNIVSRAQSSQGDNETKAIEVRRTLPSAPSFMDYALVSGTSISKE